MAEKLMEDLVEQMDSPEFKKTTNASKLRELVEKLKLVRIELDEEEAVSERDSYTKEWINDLTDVVARSDTMAETIKTVFYPLFPKRNQEEIDKIDEIDKILLELDFVCQLPGLLSFKFRCYGRKVDREEILRKLFSEDVWGSDIGVLSIVGEAGIGKTTLAQLVYNNTNVRQYFDILVWVTVSTETVPARTIQSLLMQMGGTASHIADLATLQQLIQMALRGKRFLIVVDDVRWPGNKWRELMMCFSTGDSGSRIIVTTRTEDVAMITSGDNPQAIHKLASLNDESSWSLFVFTVSHDSIQATNPDFMKFKEEVLKRCKGIPFSIIALGGTLRNNPETQWQSLLENISSEASASVEKLSYDDLQQSRKDAFLYCLLFPEDYEIDVQTLVNVWVSQQIVVSTKPGQHPEDLGYEWFENLLDRFFFKETEWDEWGKVTKCKTQSSFYELAISENDKHDFATVLSDSDIKQDHRHVSLNFHLDSTWHIPTSLSKLKSLHTLMLNRQSHWDVEGSSGNLVCKAAMKFKLLRMLDLHNSGIKIIPSSFGELKDLSYLDLSRNVNLKELPKSITSLSNLITLKLNNCNNLKALPEDISKLAKLRNLENESCYSLTHMPPRLGQLTNLRTVSEFVLTKSSALRSGKLDVLKTLNHLYGRLKIKNLRHPDDDKTQEALLKEKEHLVSLVLIWVKIKAAIDSTGCQKSLDDLKPHQNLRELSLSCYGGEHLSDWLPSQKNLVKLLLSKCHNLKSLPRLDQLAKLKVLVVDECIKLTYILEQEADGVDASTEIFPSLKELQLTNMPILKQWWNHTNGSSRRFRSLMKLIIKKCPELTYIPSFPTTLEELEFNNTPLELLQQTLNHSQASSSSSSNSLSKLKTLRMVNMKICEPATFQSFPSLQNLTLDHLSNFESNFLEELKRVTTLQELHLWRFDNLKDISGWIEGLTSLKNLSFKLCPKLEIPFEQIGLITKLSSVDVENCPLASHVELMIREYRSNTRKLKSSKTHDTASEPN